MSMINEDIKSKFELCVFDNNFEIYFTKKNEIYVDKILDILKLRFMEIMDFFKFDHLDKKVTVVLWPTIDDYKEHLKPYLERTNSKYYEWMIGDSYNGINMLSIDEIRKTKDREDYDIDEFLDTICHEFVHICHMQLNKNRNINYFGNSTRWFSELLATNLGNYNSKKIVKIERSLEELEYNFNDIHGNYNISFTVGRYLFEHYDNDYILELSCNREKLKSDAKRIYEEAMIWSQTKSK